MADTAKRWLRPLYIFDLDGTLALIDERRKLLADKSDPKRHRKFYAACVHDRPNAPVVATLRRLLETGCEIWIFSGRSDEVRAETAAWLEANTPLLAAELETSLVMRRAGDHRGDDVLKQGFIDDMLIDDRNRLVAVFDDRQRVVDVWRRNGIACFQVAPGKF